MEIYESDEASTSARSVQALNYMNNYYVYMLLCDQRTFYVGITFDINKRIIEHRSKDSFFTKKFSEIKVVYDEKFTLSLSKRIHVSPLV